MCFFLYNLHYSVKKWFPLILILLLSAFLRLYRLNDLFVFGGDEEYQSILAQTIVKHFHIIWIGVTAGHLGFYLGPFWTYFSAFWFLLSKGAPLITGYIASIIGVLTTALIIYTGNKLFNKRTGLLAGLLYATLPLIVFFDQKYWNPSLVPLLSLAMLLSLSQIKVNSKWWLIFSLCFGLVFHVHLSLLPYVLIAIFLLSKKTVDRRTVFLGVLIFLVIYSPLIFFDYFHKGSNIATPLRFKEFSSAPTTRINPQLHFNVLFQTLGRIWYLNRNSSNADEVLFACSSTSSVDVSSKQIDKISTRTIPNFWISFLPFMTIIWFSVFSFLKNNFNQKLLATSILLIATSFIFFPGGAHEYYLLGIFPLILFLPGILVNLIGNQLIKRGFLILLLVSSILGIVTILNVSDDFGINHKQKLINKVLSVIGQDSFEIDQVGICHQFGGWRYLFKLAGRLPERSATDKGLGWLYSDEITSTAAKYKVTFHEARAPINLDTKNAQTISEGGFKVYVILHTQKESLIN